MNPDSESGAEYGAVLWQLLLKEGALGAVRIEVHEPARGHPSNVHDAYGGAEIPAFRRAFVEALRARAPRREVYRLTANAFAFLTERPMPAGWTFRYRDEEVSIVVRGLEVTAR